MDEAYEKALRAWQEEMVGKITDDFCRRIVRDRVVWLSGRRPNIVFTPPSRPVPVEEAKDG